MGESQSYDLSFVAPHKREVVMQRIAVLDRYLANPTPAAARAAAAELDLAQSHFDKLARIWREDRNIERLPGIGLPKAKRSSCSEEQLEIIRSAESDSSSAPVERVVKHALEIAARRGVAMPSIGTIRTRVGELRQGRLPATWPEAVADVFVEHCAIDLPVRADGITTMPVATMVVDRVRRLIVGLDLSIDGPVGSPASTIHALLDPLVDENCGEQARSIGIDEYTAQGWGSLIRSIEEAGMMRVGRKCAVPPMASPTQRLIGPRPGGLRLRPGLTARLPFQRHPRIPVNGHVMTLEEANSWARKRIRLTVAGGSPLPANMLGRLRSLVGDMTAR